MRVLLNNRDIWPVHPSLLEWLRTRLWIKKIAALWCLLMFFSLLMNDDPLNTLSAITQLSALIFLAITAFRLWDDLADIAFDLLHHSNRILANIDATTTLILYGFVSTLLVLVLLLLSYFSGMSKTIGLGLLISFIATVYFCLPALTKQRALRNALVLLKYPAMLLVLSNQPMNLQNGVIVLVLYGLLVAYEAYEFFYNKP